MVVFLYTASPGMEVEAPNRRRWLKMERRAGPGGKRMGTHIPEGSAAFKTMGWSVMVPGGSGPGDDLTLLRRAGRDGSPFDDTISGKGHRGGKCVMKKEGRAEGKEVRRGEKEERMLIRGRDQGRLPKGTQRKTGRGGEGRGAEGKGGMG